MYKIQNTATGKFIGGTYAYPYECAVGRQWDGLHGLRMFLSRAIKRKEEMLKHQPNSDYYRQTFDFTNWRVVQVELTITATQTIEEFYAANKKRGSKRASTESAST